MAKSIEIPLFSDPHWEMKVDLSGKRYGFCVSYNTLQDMWTMYITDANEKLILAGIRLVPGVSFFKKYRASCPDLPPGDLWLLDKEGNMKTAEVTRDNLHTRFALTYTVSDDVQDDQ
jgi:hypothetical protein